MTLKQKLLSTGILLTVIPLLVSLGVAIGTSRVMIKKAAESVEALGAADLNHVAKNAHAMCVSQQETLEKHLGSFLKVARDVLSRAGKVSLAEETVSWTAVNQFSKKESRVDLPRMMAGSLWLGNNASLATASPVVDEVQALTEATCTVFQRMNEQGDMLRVCTNVKTLDGTRAIGTYIPRIGEDGIPNPVVDVLLRGESFYGRAFVVSKWYISAYEPIFDENRQVIGALYVGIPQESTLAIRKALMGIRVGKTGYVFVLDSKGTYVISHEGKRDGESLWESKDEDGNLLIQSMCRKAVGAAPGESVEFRYFWKNPGEAKSREKIAQLIYFKPWDWVIGVSAYADEFQEEVEKVRSIGQWAVRVLAGLSGAALLLTIVVWLLTAGRITGALNRIVHSMDESASQVATASGQIAGASQQLAAGASEQAAGLEETSSSLEEMSAMTKQSAENARQANVLVGEARKAANSGAESMGRMSAAINDIQQSSSQTAKIIKVIDEIAFQTNLLALNAAVEAARAGEAGKGFAVVAEEVRNLAKRSAEAAKNTAALIEESVGKAKSGVDIAKEVGATLSEIVAGIGKTADLVSEIAAAASEQAQGIDQVNIAVAQMDKVTQSNAANAEESAGASEELSSQAEQMNDMVEDLLAMVDSQSSRRERRKSVPVRRDSPKRQVSPAARSLPVDEELKDFNG